MEFAAGRVFTGLVSMVILSGGFASGDVFAGLLIYVGEGLQVEGGSCVRKQ